MLIGFLSDIIHNKQIWNHNCNLFLLYVFFFFFLAFYIERNKKLRYSHPWATFGKAFVFLHLFFKVKNEGVNRTQPIQSEIQKTNSELTGSISHLSDKMCKSVSTDHGELYFTVTKGQMEEIVALGWHLSWQ